jgi:hypothetical protein
MNFKNSLLNSLRFISNLKEEVSVFQRRIETQILEEEVDYPEFLDQLGIESKISSESVSMNIC